MGDGWQLESDDAAAVAALVERLGGVADLEAFGAAVAGAFLELIPGISATYTEVAPGSERAYAVIVPEPDPAWWGEAQATFERHIHQHPVLQALQRDGDRGATTWDDVGDVAAFRRTELYREFYAPLGIESQLIAPLPAPEGTFVVLAVNRGPEGFSARDRAVVDVVRARAVQAYRAVQQRADRAALHAALVGEGWWVVLVGADGRVEDGPLAEAAPIAPGRPLPEPLRTAFHEAVDANRRPAGPPRRSDPVRLVLDDAGVAGTFTAIVVPNTLPPHVVLLRFAPSATEVVREATGLTRRQVEVAVAVAGGSSNAEVARVLGISPATVKKHLEAVYAGLGVRSRSEAVVTVNRLLTGAAARELPSAAGSQPEAGSGDGQGRSGVDLVRPSRSSLA